MYADLQTGGYNQWPRRMRIDESASQSGLLFGKALEVETDIDSFSPSISRGIIDFKAIE
jgi:hypothetical protein